jgi:Flp pilus assembly pilin Flp
MRFSRGRRALGTDEGGVYQTEYTIVLILVALALAGALALLAAPLVEYHDAVVRILDTPIL